jgi:hypothetical protein
MIASAIGCCAQAQVSGAKPTFDAEISASSAAPPLIHRSLRRLKPGMAVIDRRGARVGIVQQVGQTRDGKPAVIVNMDGTPIKVATSKLKITGGGDEARISLTRSQIRTAAILNTAE